MGVQEHVFVFGCACVQIHTGFCAHSGVCACTCMGGCVSMCVGECERVPSYTRISVDACGKVLLCARSMCV